jgi:polysaccharide biosynthesis/export protein
VPPECEPKTKRAGRCAMLLMLCSALASPAVAPAQTPTPTPAAGAGQPYVLGPADVLEVSIPGRTDFTTRTRINEQGQIALPYLASVTAAGKTTAQLVDEIGRDLDKGGFFAHPIVSVEIVSYASKYVTVLGDVTSPGLVPVDRPYHLSEILARVGGVKETGADYVILRPETGGDRHLSIESLITGDSSQDPYISPGDKIFSPKADQFYVSGQVNTPGTYPLIEGMTVRMAIARGGGLNIEGSLGKVEVTRHGVKLKQIDLNGKIEPGDIVVVGERLF